MMTLTLALVLILAMPLCASVAGVVVWAAHRNETADDGELVTHFLAVLILGMALLWWISRTETVRLRLDPQLRMETEIKRDPLYLAVEQSSREDSKALREFLGVRLARGEPLSQALLEARSFLTRSVNERLGWADQDSRLLWGRLTIDSLQELREKDPALCYRFMATWTLDEQDLRQAFSAENTAAFQSAVAQLYRSSNAGMGRRGRAPGDEPVSFNEAAVEFQAIRADIEQRFGRSIADPISHKKLPAPPSASPDTFCAARIYQLQSMLKRPKGQASMLIDSVLR